jgi:uncharacterized membrane protein HdeD (DUF308 family)
MSKTLLMVVGLLVLVMGILGFISSIEWASEPTWYAAVQVIIGLISLGVAAADKPVA